MIKPLLLLTLLPCAAHAAALFAPGNTIFGVRSDGTSLLIATAGGDGGNNVYTDNFHPVNEAPNFAIDGFGQKYLNFAELNTGVMVSPAGGLPSIADSLQVWTANDAFARDPSSYEVWGTNQPLNGGGMALSSFTLISSGALALPGVTNTDSRNPGGTAALNPSFSATVTFANSTPYLNYLILFPTVKDEVAANSMQIAELQLFGNVVPEPGSALLAGLAVAGLALRRRRS